ncbi:MAG: ATP-dependent Clp protease ATP-binding subunit, partial [Oscillospiraceae bacterium]|nr:ATP-dependent Clp protease ATP-binding subunit [Oscillospiraceae bacterium]
MQPTICARCKKNVAVIYITRIENGESKNEGLCLKCARELHIKPVDDIISKMGLTDDELDGLTSEMMEALGGSESLMDIENSEENSDEDGKTATFPFLNRLFGANNMNGGEPMGSRGGEEEEAPPRKESGGHGGKKRFLDNYCICLTERARAGKLDRMIGREEELERVIQILNRRQKNNPCLIGEPGV